MKCNATHFILFDNKRGSLIIATLLPQLLCRYFPPLFHFFFQKMAHKCSLMSLLWLPNPTERTKIWNMHNILHILQELSLQSSSCLPLECTARRYCLHSIVPVLPHSLIHTHRYTHRHKQTQTHIYILRTKFTYTASRCQYFPSHTKKSLSSS